jgi:hypothetical protein
MQGEYEDVSKEIEKYYAKISIQIILPISAACKSLFRYHNSQFIIIIIINILLLVVF